MRGRGGVRPPVDLDVLTELIGDDARVKQEVLATFRASTERSALDLAHAQADGTAQAMADIAHTLKSAAWAIGAARLGQLCADIEAAATTSSIDAGTSDDRALLGEIGGQLAGLGARRGQSHRPHGRVPLR